MEAVLFVAIVFGGLAGWWAMARLKPVRYRRKAVLTGDEREFYFRMLTALPECHVCPQVAASALIDPAGMGKLRQRAGSVLGGKRVGFAVFDEDMELLAVVELTHRSRPTRAERAREACFASAGIRTVRFLAKRLPSENKIRTSIFNRRLAKSSLQARLEAEKELEFRKAPWRNTVNAHI
ncbi:DUF2726 domain-containing protein [Noviherbaspirillum denitrificans]|uniref:DUF2726 domain-containing protein n=1 Tax=Noviherbaspirillum denitrificans TaxID=1968433 RepID=A0A254TG82_9BURK|nr:DUF2726 domain-containing protein [Noviherbaspirillum denitrificans]OWW20322.1 hypothetical protein AYR66_13280 [Noviherbaspirillum denitrificans]